MVGKYRVITLCGSTRFKEEFIEAQKRLTLAGNIVISVGLFGHSGDDEVWEGMSEDTLTKTKEMLDDMHKRKIDMADEIFVINVGGYIGSSTRSEIEYAQMTGKTVRYLENPEDCYVPEINLDHAICRLKSRKKAIQTYTEIMEMSGDPMNPDFQRKYVAFYRVRRNEMWRGKYLRLMADYRGKESVSFGEVMMRLFQTTGWVEASFSSKMLATLDPDMPIWDSNVLTALRLQLKGSAPEVKMSNAVVLYDSIRQWYIAFLQKDEAKEMLARFDRVFPEYKSLTSTKKIDFILWASQ